MSNQDDRILKIATGIAIVALIIGGSLYMGAVLGPGSSRSVPGPRAGRTGPMVDAVPATRAERTPPADDEGGGGMTAPPTREPAEDPPDAISGGRPPVLPGVMDLATRATVKPESEKDAAREMLEGGLPGIEQCWRDSVEEPTRVGRAFVHFRVTDGVPAQLSVQSRGVGERAMEACIKAVVGQLDTSGLSEETSVYWPIELHPEEGAKL